MVVNGVNPSARLPGRNRSLLDMLNLRVNINLEVK
jgi:hypothetical protein